MSEKKDVCVWEYEKDVATPHFHACGMNISYAPYNEVEMYKVCPHCLRPMIIEEYGYKYKDQLNGYVK